MNRYCLLLLLCEVFLSSFNHQGYKAPPKRLPQRLCDTVPAVDKSGVDLQSLIPVEASDSFYVSFTTHGETNNHILVNGLRALGLGMAAYGVTHEKKAEGEVTTATIKRSYILPITGLGIAISANKLSKIGHKNKTTVYLKYSFYNQHLDLLSKGVIPINTKRLNKQFVFSGKVEQNGYFEAQVVFEGSQSGSLGEPAIAISHTIIPGSGSDIHEQKNDAYIETPTFSPPPIHELPDPSVAKIEAEKGNQVRLPESHHVTIEPNIDSARSPNLPQPHISGIEVKSTLVNGSGEGHKPSPTPASREGSDKGLPKPITHLGFIYFKVKSEDPNSDEDGNQEDEIANPDTEPVKEPDTDDDDDDDVDEDDDEDDADDADDCDDDGGGADTDGDDDDDTEDDDDTDDPCDESSPDYSASECEEATCDELSPDYDAQECQAQTCDETSVNYDDNLCDQETCDPTTVNYNASECAAQKCVTIDPTVYSQDLAAYQANNTNGTALVNQVFNSYFNAQFTALGMTAPVILTGTLPPSSTGCTGWASNGAFVFTDNGESYDSYSFTNPSSGTIYLSNIVMNGGLDDILGYMSHELMLSYFVQKGMTAYINTPLGEACAYAFEADIWTILGQTANASAANTSAANLMDSIGKSDYGTSFPAYPNAPC